MRILIIDDDQELLDLLAFTMKRASIEALTVTEPPPIGMLLRVHQPELIVLDINLGHVSGLDFLAELRRSSTLPVILLTGRSAVEDRIRGLEMGADDYLSKPFDHRELVVRIRTIMRRIHPESAAPPAAPAGRLLQCGPLTLNEAEYTVTNRGQVVDLTLTEYRLLHYLMLRTGTVVPLADILRQIWNDDRGSRSEVYRSTLHRLRQKLGENAETPRLLHTIHGIGAMLKPLPDDS